MPRPQQRIEYRGNEASPEVARRVEGLERRAWEQEVVDDLETQLQLGGWRVSLRQQRCSS